NVSRVEVICSGEPSLSSVNAAVDQLVDHGIEGVIAVGGGSVIDAGKAVAFCLGHDLILNDDFSQLPASRLAHPGPVPCIAVPSTAGTGAEVTANAVLDIPSQRAKISLRGRALCPAAAFVDPGLLRSAPASVLLSSGLDAVVQTMEAYTSCAATPFSDMFSAPNIARGLAALQAVMEGEPADPVWEDLAWVSLSSGVALANGGLGAAHGIASVLGGRYGAPHGALCGRLLVPVLRKNTEMAGPGTLTASRLRDCAVQCAAAFSDTSHKDPFSGLEAWQDRHALPRLREFGIRTEDFPALAEASAAASSSRKNAVPLTVVDFQDILQEAF
ncbi:MAG: iron-containing alcohol dehydrogenase, partial [Pseudomonadota bacterium]